MIIDLHRFVQSGRSTWTELERLLDQLEAGPTQRMSIVELKDGRVLNGLIAAKTERTLTLKTMTETLTVEREEIVAIRESSLSLMPEGLLEALTTDQARDLIAYLKHKSQAPLPSVASSN
jgi:putative heme-binding domain-containing protein